MLPNPDVAGVFENQQPPLKAVVPSGGGYLSGSSGWGSLGVSVTPGESFSSFCIIIAAGSVVLHDIVPSVHRESLLLISYLWRLH